MPGFVLSALQGPGRERGTDQVEGFARRWPKPTKQRSYETKEKKDGVYFFVAH